MGTEQESGVLLGALVSWGPHEQIGVVQGIQVDGDGEMVDVGFDDGTHKYFKTEAGVIQRIRLQPGDQVMRPDGQLGVVLESVTTDEYPTWKVAFAAGVSNVAEIGLRPAVIDDPIARMRNLQLGNAEEFNLRAVAADYWFANRHSALVSLGHARVDLKPHQVSVVHRVISNYPHRFMLCDEVGLGKTIEAAMIIKELRARGHAKRVLILAPSGLMRQWQFELKTKFNEAFAIYNQRTFGHYRDLGAENPWMENDSIITSHTWASWTPERREEITDVPWDMIVVDEAHHARARRQGHSTTRTNLFRLVNDLVAGSGAARKAVLLLTATPLQLERFELYSLCDMLNPVLFASEEDFDAHMDSISGLNRIVERLEQGVPGDEAELAELVEDVALHLEIDDDEALGMLLGESLGSLIERLRALHRVSEVLIRNRKKVVGGFQPRSAVTWEVELSERERKVHELMDDVFQRGFAHAAETGQNVVGFQMVMLQKLLASSSRALLASLAKRREKLGGNSPRKLAEAEAQMALEEDTEAADVLDALGDSPATEAAEFDEIMAELRRIKVDSKAKRLHANLEELFSGDTDAKVLIFTEFRETQAMLADLLAPLAEVHLFHGQMNAEAKDAAVNSFRRGQGPQVLVSTEAGGEGRNFQFCHLVVNYDLPWNPMKVEQRIGRVDRIGQEHPVVIFNFHVKGTIEGRILEVLERRINIFEEAVGGLDPILGQAEAGIRAAVGLADHERDAAIARLGLRIGQEVQKARRAEEQLADFIMDAKSFSAEIARSAIEAEAPITQVDFEKFEMVLLKSVGTYIGPVDESGECRIFFHPPFSLEHPELVGGQDARRVCFDPRLNTDSEFVEYLGFGHPVIDALVRRTIEERVDGASAVRSVDPRAAGLERPGWQFNWKVTVGGLSSREFLFPVFVPDGGEADADAGERLLKLSRRFAPESSHIEPPLGGLDEAAAEAQRVVVSRRDVELTDARSEAAERGVIARERANALFGARVLAAQDRVDACEQTLARLREADDRQRRQAIPLWEANLARARDELARIKEDLERDLIDISQDAQPTAEFMLLGLARIELAEQAD
jgi:SNF2 family DNA or RNA helicase